jgi:hypothetical protein
LISAESQQGNKANMKYWTPTASDMPPTQFEDLSHCTKHCINAPYLGLINNALDALHKSTDATTELYIWMTLLLLSLEEGSVIEKVPITARFDN